MRVSVVIPTYNAAALAVEAVQSVLGQTQTPHEIIVVDDGSTDDTAERLKDLPVRLIRQENAGPAAARNAGIAVASGDVIAFLDADDVWHPLKLERQLPFLHDASLVAADFFDWPGPVPELPAANPHETPIPLERLVVRNSIVTSTVLTRTALIRDVGGFDARLHGPEDYDLWLRIAQAGPCHFLPLPLAGYRQAAGSVSKNADRMEAGMRLILEKLDTAGVFHGKPLLRRKAWGYFHYSCGYMHREAGNRGQAKRHLLKSLLKYPLPYSREDVRYLFGRLRLLLS